MPVDNTVVKDWQKEKGIPRRGKTCQRINTSKKLVVVFGIPSSQFFNHDNIWRAFVTIII